jgi:hypothetical protein
VVISGLDGYRESPQNTTGAPGGLHRSAPVRNALILQSFNREIVNESFNAAIEDPQCAAQYSL